MASKNIVICCDGTSNEPKANGASNVFELMRVLKRTKTQIIYYDPGLGTESAPAAQTFIGRWVTKILSLAFGYGLKQNIVDAYGFLMEKYEPGDKIFIFGFSRGAYTARAIAGMLHTIGLLDKGSHHLLSYAAKKYMQQGKREWDNIGVFKSALSRRLWETSPRYAVPIHFLGVWDTVKSVGLFRNSVRLPYTSRLPNTENAFHAVSLDEKRSKFRPDIWTAHGSVKGKVRTMWFQGTHSDIGGGHPEHEKGLSDEAMRWMVPHGMECGLEIDEGELQAIWDSRPNQDEPEFEQIHNSLLPGWFIFRWWLLGWRRRNLPDRAWVNAAAVDRVLSGTIGDKRKHPFKLLKSMSTKRVLMQEDIVCIRADQGYLIQKLTPTELDLLCSKSLSSDDKEAQLNLLEVGAKSWHFALEAALSQDSISISNSSAKKARLLVSRAVEKISKGKIKGKRGAMADILTMTRMRSLKTAGILDRLQESSPGLIEALAEQ